MHKRSLRFFAILLTLILAALACSFSTSTANIEDAWLAFDPEGEQETTVFDQDDVFNAIVELSNAPDDTTVKAAWTVVQAEGEAADTLMHEDELTSGSATLHFELSNAKLWPTGSYKVDIYLDDELDTTLAFEVQASHASPPEPTAPPQTSGARIQNAYMSLDNDGLQPAQVFPQEAVFYCVVELVDAPEDTHIKAVWAAVQAEGMEPNTYLDEYEYTGSSDTITFNLSNTDLWSPGRYKVDLYINDQLDRAVEFDVAAAEGPPPSAGPSVQDAYTARDSEGNAPTQVFAPQDVFYCIVELSHGQDDTVVKAVWTGVAIEGYEPNLFLKETTLVTDGDSMYFELSNEELWPLGAYKVELYVNDQLAYTLEFEVQ